MLSRKPYLLRAMHQWISDSGMTPHIVVDVAVEGVDVPPGYAKDGKLVLNISYEATQGLELGNEQVAFSARFGGVARNLYIPMQALLAVYAHETGQGMVFGPEQEPPPSDPDTTVTKPDAAPRKPSLKVVK
ncbi:MAG TPA: ClpXP protease specificity-enhancing factor [Gammaproteobacteria bacterium]|nr:ClpXP protease specificity-enhancing factor [Gammaproteobacteria bacterium]